ncbi:MAG TPA: SDR family oxidoreductase [Saprospiraceae bacterium]|nr:SDR family oxidoreductase [Saprospiraceae bacterium]
MHYINLENKHALICGASKGIGKACAFALAGAGASVTVIARNTELLEELIHRLPKSGHQEHRALSADLSDPDDLDKKVHALVLSHPVHILVNNSGGPASGPVLTAASAAFEQAFRQHLISSHVLATRLAPGMKMDGYGRIINIISTSVKQPLDNLGVSNTIRGAVANWAKTLSNELASDHITVNNVLPGATETERLMEIIHREASHQQTTADAVSAKMIAAIPMKRFAKPEEIANAVLFLASPLAAYITGINLPVDGGRTKSL